MSNRIRYAYLKDNTWLYRRHYPKDVADVFGLTAHKQSLRTSDSKVARSRAAEVNHAFDATVTQARSGAESLLVAPGWEERSEQPLARLRDTLEASGRVLFADAKTRPRVTVGELARDYLNHRSDQLRPGGFKSVRYSVGLFASKFYLA